jgi:hypothetical protein
MTVERNTHSVVAVRLQYLVRGVYKMDTGRLTNPMDTDSLKNPGEMTIKQ